VCGLVLVDRIHHVSVRFPAPGVGKTYVLAVSDHRAQGPPQADAVLIMHEFGFRNTVLSAPQDLMVSATPGRPEPLARTLQQGPQALIDGLCNTLGVAASRVVIVSSSGLSSIVDGLGGVDIDLPYPVRDPASGLSLTQTGTVHVDGAQALALVRAGQPQLLVHGRWVAVPSAAALPSDWAAEIFNSLADAAKDHIRDPWSLPRLAWIATSSLTVSQNIGVFDLVKLARLHGEAAPLPAHDLPGSTAVQADDSTRSALAAAGYGGSCAASRPR
jgi:hypothetical protein